MKHKSVYLTIIGIFLFSILGLIVWKYWPVYKIQLKPITFAELPDWNNADAMNSLLAFQTSCKILINQDPNNPAGSSIVPLKVQDWLPACQAALAQSIDSNIKAREFFQTWFNPYAIYKRKVVKGLFTGYYMPYFTGSLTKTKLFKVPVYGSPNNIITANLGLFDPSLASHRKLIGRIDGKVFVPYFTREQIRHGAIKQYAPILAWLDSEIDRQFLEIEGSGIIKLPNGKKLPLNYAGENGRKYTSIAQILIDMGVMNKDNASMQRIRKYFQGHPEQVDSIINQNQSFVFFAKSNKEEAIGTMGTVLTPGYSMAIDPKWIPYATPLWLSTTRPDESTQNQIPFHRLMIAQDIGGAIRGEVRGDIYWGTGAKARYIAGHMKNQGYYWLLLPRKLSINNTVLTH